MPKNDSTVTLKKQLKELQNKITLLEKNQPNKNQEAPLPEPKTFKVETLYHWESPERLFVPRNKKWFIYLFTMILLIIAVLLFASQFIVIAPLAAIGFVLYVLATVPPHSVEHKLTTEGLSTGGHSYLWQEMWDFWITKKGDEKLIHIDTYLDFPRRIIILAGNGEVEKIKEVMTQYIPFREIPKETILDKFSNSFTQKFNKLAK